MKRVLIISPYFPPTNAADMQRIRMSLPYFSKYGWNAEVVVVDARHADMVKDDLLLQSVPEYIPVHTVGAFPKKLTSRLGLGSIALRSLWHYRKKVNSLLTNNSYDLIYFSTTQFPVCILGAYWKRKFEIPYVIDIQDPWHSEYYQSKPKDERPRKYWLSYSVNKYLEPLAMRNANGIISVSQRYIDTLMARYPQLKDQVNEVITFGTYLPDLEIALDHQSEFRPLLDSDFKSLVYIGRGGHDMAESIQSLLQAFKTGLSEEPTLFKRLKIYFIGTSYAAAGTGIPTVSPLAGKLGLDGQIIEITDRISFYQTLLTLSAANALFIPGSEDPAYSASKLYPYINTGKPLLAVLNTDGALAHILEEFGVKTIYDYRDTDLQQQLLTFLRKLINGELLPPHYEAAVLTRYGAENMTRKQVVVFDEVLAKQIKK